MYDVIARPLQFYYELWPSYAGAITLLTLTVMLVLLPLTLKGTRSMLAMQRLQPELKKLQNQHRDDRQKLNEEVMKFYKENNINPLSGCMPLLLQMPIFIILYRTLHDLLWRASSGWDLGAATARAANGVNKGVWEQFGNFQPKHLDPTSQLYRDLSSTNEMSSLGMNLAQSAQQALSHGAATAAPYIILVMAVAGTSYYQQRQIAGRPGGSSVNPQQQMLLKIMPVFFAFISLTLPAGLVVYFLVSNLFRIGQQALITHTMYKDHPDTIETTATDADKSSTKSSGGIFALIKEQANASAKARDDLQKAKANDKPSGGAKQTSGTSTKPPASGSKTKAAPPSRSAPAPANRSKAKKKRR
ncbi:MAG TPA: YidC/Oxa1 family membrane protein insertase [Acidimicrobiales bacterium]|jgi:YidC/Oxa1 family membrane protein insertase|nr:YidC/Oxa1 family membrane protein insertase [Acidimicrobiales bacterium]HMS87118.1 YidC/Oxa1 family membrane protein insertase [Acidimicrobiales bacterium]HRA33424.1 YidC/Oxa1 family membrane protein insertase [Acidimicrobiales bacterium]